MAVQAHVIRPPPLASQGRSNESWASPRVYTIRPSHRLKYMTDDSGLGGRSGLYYPF